MKKLLFTICILCALVGDAQDIHFSQFNVAPMVYNPALAGGFDGDIRFIGNQRTQWRSVTAPYSTIGVSADFNHKNQPLMGSAFSIYQDRAGDSKLNTIAVNGAFSYEIAQSADELHKASRFQSIRLLCLSERTCRLRVVEGDSLIRRQAGLRINKSLY